MRGVIYCLLATFLLFVCYSKLTEKKIVSDYYKMSEQIQIDAKLKSLTADQEFHQQMLDAGKKSEKHFLLYSIDPTMPKVEELEQRCTDLTLKSYRSESIYDKNIAELECDKYEAYKLANES
ncbi:hypothetical protein HHE92_05140 [Pseudoalteromonas arctica]|uniref:Uncharacterized protein n=2 Tax=Pseudoalteromonas TaxID=53246 RepID=A0AAP6Y045_9GAMM|nr:MULTISPECIES: hypothetical protein [Pseudoalteromonas]MBH0018160.1 hypothetical protein [Pseudoalteromonas sp. NGC95]MBH0045755.1 hypothetical protein [Pseudoalteromonas sp. NZS11_1]MBZ2192737.1 hypothetical protein [Pseudoalteromonas arctica]MDN3384713.1 hypothetical protein [Pseudoalteromonas sp. APC 3358]NMP01211.1 hypothetical protein [Pseudoalteromonas arctica]